MCSQLLRTIMVNTKSAYEIFQALECFRFVIKDITECLVSLMELVEVFGHKDININTQKQLFLFIYVRAHDSHLV